MNRIPYFSLKSACSAHRIASGSQTGSWEPKVILFTPFIHKRCSASPTLTSARPPTRVWEVVRTVAAPPSIVVKCVGVVLRVVVYGVVLVVCLCV